MPRELRRVLVPRERASVEGMTVEAFPVRHSVRAPAVGLRIDAGRRRVFYAPDVLAIPRRGEALADLDAHVGDGASIVRPIVRREELRGRRVGHASIRDQLDRCAAERVPRMLVTHCGSQILRDEEEAEARIAQLARERAVRIEVARDGMELSR